MYVLNIFKLFLLSRLFFPDFSVAWSIILLFLSFFFDCAQQSTASFYLQLYVFLFYFRYISSINLRVFFCLRLIFLFFFAPAFTHPETDKKSRGECGENEINEGRKQYYHSLKLVNLRREKKSYWFAPTSINSIFQFLSWRWLPKLCCRKKATNTQKVL